MLSLFWDLGQDSVNFGIDALTSLFYLHWELAATFFYYIASAPVHPYTGLLAIAQTLKTTIFFHILQFFPISLKPLIIFRTNAPYFFHY